jgi:hypothetical protein
MVGIEEMWLTVFHSQDLIQATSTIDRSPKRSHSSIIFAFFGGLFLRIMVHMGLVRRLSVDGVAVHMGFLHAGVAIAFHRLPLVQEPKTPMLSLLLRLTSSPNRHPLQRKPPPSHRLLRRSLPPSCRCLQPSLPHDTPTSTSRSRTPGPSTRGD